MFNNDDYFIQSFSDWTIALFFTHLHFWLNIYLCLGIGCIGLKARSYLALTFIWSRVIIYNLWAMILLSSRWDDWIISFITVHIPTFITKFQQHSVICLLMVPCFIWILPFLMNNVCWSNLSILFKLQLTTVLTLSLIQSMSIALASKDIMVEYCCISLS